MSSSENDSLSLEEKSSSASKRRLDKVVKSSQAATSHSLSDKSSDSLGFGTRFLTLDFTNSSDSVSGIVSKCSSPILRVSSGSTVAGSESRPPTLNKENYVPWSSRLLRYAKSRPNGKLIHKSILNCPYVRRMIPEPGDTNREVPKEVDELKVERLAKTQDPLAPMANSNNPYAFPAPHQDQPSFNQNYMQQPMPNPEDITDPTTAMNMALALMAKAFKLTYSTPTNNNQMISSNPCNRQIAQPGMDIGQDRQMQMVGGNGENQFRQYARQNVGNLNGYNAVQNVGNQVAQNPRVQNVGNQNGLIGVPGNANLNGNGNLVAARAEGNAAGYNGN
nr:hypothetical protein [Tanacetum cinerariifolium]